MEAFNLREHITKNNINQTTIGQMIGISRESLYYWLEQSKPDKIALIVNAINTLAENYFIDINKLDENVKPFYQHLRRDRPDTININSLSNSQVLTNVNIGNKNNFNIKDSVNESIVVQTLQKENLRLLLIIDELNKQLNSAGGLNATVKREQGRQEE